MPTADKQKYLGFVRKSAVIFKRHGAEQLAECWGDDVPEGKLTSFPMAVQCQSDETVVFSWVRWPSKAACEDGMKKVMTEHQAEFSADSMPFEGKRMIFGGFEVISEA